MNAVLKLLVVTMGMVAFASKPGWSQEPFEANVGQAANATKVGEEPQPSTKVDVQPIARDSQIATRLKSILTATEWFESPEVEVRDGVAFLRGITASAQYKTWAGDLARRTQDVAAVVNKIEIRHRPLWDLGPARQEIEVLWRNFLLALPNILLSLLVLAVAWWMAS